MLCDQLSWLLVSCWSHVKYLHFTLYFQRFSCGDLV